VSFCDFFRDAIDEVPDVIGELPARSHFGNVFSLAKVTLAYRNIGIWRHDRGCLVVVDIELRPRPANCTFEKFFVRIAKVIEAFAELGVALPSVESEPIRVFCQDLLGMGHCMHAVGDHESVGLSNPETHEPPHRGIAHRAEAHIELPDRKIRFHHFVDFRQRNRV